MAARFDLHPDFARRIESGKYWLFDMECPTEVMAAYESLWSTVYRRQQNGDKLLAWAVTTTLIRGDVEFGERLMAALEKLGWQRSA
jgi:hypothetical protein